MQITLSVRSILANIGKQVYIDEEYHTRLKKLSAELDRPMKDLVEESISRTMTAYNAGHLDE